MTKRRRSHWTWPLIAEISPRILKELKRAPSGIGAEGYRWRPRSGASWRETSVWPWRTNGENVMCHSGNCWLEGPSGAECTGKNAGKKETARSLGAVKKRSNAFDLRDQCLVAGRRNNARGRNACPAGAVGNVGRAFSDAHGRFPFDPHTRLDTNCRVDEGRILDAPDLTLPDI